MEITHTTTLREAYLIGLKDAHNLHRQKLIDAAQSARASTPEPATLLVERVRKGRKLNFANKRAMTAFVIGTLEDENPSITELLRLPREVDEATKRLHAIQKTVDTVSKDLYDTHTRMQLNSAFQQESELKAELDGFTAAEFFTDFEEMVKVNLKPKKTRRVKKVKPEVEAVVENAEGEAPAEPAPAPKSKRKPKKDLLG